MHITWVIKTQQHNADKTLNHVNGSEINDCVCECV